MRVLAVDFGDARTGIAMSDLLCSIVGSTTVIHNRNQDKTIDEILRLVKENDVGEIVVGLPKNMNGTEGPRADLCREFADKLRHKFFRMSRVEPRCRRATVDGQEQKRIKV